MLLCLIRMGNIYSCRSEQCSNHGKCFFQTLDLAIPWVVQRQRTLPYKLYRSLNKLSLKQIVHYCEISTLPSWLSKTSGCCVIRLDVKQLVMGGEPQLPLFPPHPIFTIINRPSPQGAHALRNNACSPRHAINTNQQPIRQCKVAPLMALRMCQVNHSPCMTSTCNGQYTCALTTQHMGEFGRH